METAEKILLVIMVAIFFMSAIIIYSLQYIKSFF